ncbi:MAG: matrixin family metalloprotease [Mariprofundaceae bacterium]
MIRGSILFNGAAMLFFLLVHGTNLFAYCLGSDATCVQDGTQVSTWANKTTSFDISAFVGVSSTSPSSTFVSVPPGAAATATEFEAAFTQAMADWNGHSLFSFSGEIGASDPCSLTDTRNGWGFSSQFCGVSFGTSTLGITQISMSGFSFPLPIVNSFIIFNSAKTWGVHSGANFVQRDFQRVAVHELGHAFGLKHEATTPAIMDPFYSDTIATPQQDDINGIIALYGAATNTSPVIIPPPNIVIQVNNSATTLQASNQAIDLFLNTVSASDVEDGVLANIQNDAPASFSTGITRVTFSVTDSSGVTVSATAVVMIQVLNSTQSITPLAKNPSTTSEYAVPLLLQGTGLTLGGDLINAISVGGSSIQKWDVNLQQRVSQSSLNNFTLNVGDVYFISVSGDASLNLSGTLPANPVFSLVNNPSTTSENMVFLYPGMKAAQSITDSASLIAAIKAKTTSGLGNVSLQKWDPGLQQRVSASTLNAFVINEGEGYFVSVSESVSWP